MGKQRTPATFQYQPVPFAPPGFRSPFGEFGYSPEGKLFSLDRGEELAESWSDESRRRALLRQLLPQLGVTSPQRESLRDRFERAFYDRLLNRIQEHFSSAQQEALEQLGARNLLGSSLEARRLKDLESSRAQSVTEAARQAIISSEELARQDEEMKLALVRALERGIADEFSRRLQAARLVTGVGLQGAGLHQRAQESLNQLRFSAWRERLRSGSNLSSLLGDISRGASLSKSLAKVIAPVVLSALSG